MLAAVRRHACVAVVVAACTVIAVLGIVLGR